MFKLPENKPQKQVDTPRNFFIYGDTMSGKSYLANEFPNPIILNTDGNATANTVPSIQLENVKDKNGKITKSVIEQLAEIMLALRTQEHTYQTVVVDVIDDVLDLITFALQDRFEVDSLSEIGYGKGYAMLKSVTRELIADLKALPMNVIYISRLEEKFDDKGKKIGEAPSLPQKQLNQFNGNCDLMIKTRKIGETYMREVDRKRKNYKPEEIDDPEILDILMTIRNAFPRGAEKNIKSTKKTVNTKTQAVDDEEDF